MGIVHAEASAVIDAPPARVYGVLADYRQGHPAILPKQYFRALDVERGGQGAGTVVRVQMRVMGVERSFRQEVSEPQPGRVLVEADQEAGAITTFTVEPNNSGDQSRVTIATDTRKSPGFAGWMESLVNPIILQRIYQEELKQLAAYLQKE